MESSNMSEREVLTVLKSATLNKTLEAQPGCLVGSGSLPDPIRGTSLHAFFLFSFSFGSHVWSIAVYASGCHPSV